MSKLLQTLATAILVVALPAFAAPKPAPKPAAPAAAPDVPLTPGQLDAASHVFVGTAACDFDNKVTLTAIDGHPGHFQLAHKKSVYTMVPEETTTGAVRLEDKKAGAVWLQIPAKSMLMNAKLGQRVADGCRMNEQAAAK